MNETLTAAPRLTDPGPLRLFQQQFGVASREQLLALGIHRDATARAVARGTLKRVFPGVFRFAATPETPELRLAAARLAVHGAVISHRSAAGLLRLSGFEQLTIVEVSTTSGARAKGVVVHRVDSLDTTIARGIGVTTLGRTLLDLCAVARPEVVAGALDAAIRQKRITYAEIARLHAARSPQTKAARVMRELLSVRGPEDAHAASELETRFLQLLRRHKLPLPDHVNADLREHGQYVARPDAGWERPRVLVFLDSREFHSSGKEFEKDRAQANALTARGWAVLRYTWSQVTEGEAAVARELGRLLARD